MTELKQKSDEKPLSEAEKFDAATRKILTVPKKELWKREKAVVETKSKTSGRVQ
jgi:uncharacterized HAD superfamily protein